MDNPYKRLRELTGTMQKDFASKYSFSKTTMVYVESGQYPDLSDDMILALGKECAFKGVDAKQVLSDEYNAETLQDAYHTWQSGERLQIASQFQQTLMIRSDKTTSPFKNFLLDIAGSTQRFCKMLKVPAAAVTNYSSGQTRTMPKSIKDALTQVQYPYLSELEQAQADWLG